MTCLTLCRAITITSHSFCLTHILPSPTPCLTPPGLTCTLPHPTLPHTRLHLAKPPIMPHTHLASILCTLPHTHLASHAPCLTRTLPHTHLASHAPCLTRTLPHTHLASHIPCLTHTLLPSHLASHTPCLTRTLPPSHLASHAPCLLRTMPHTHLASLAPCRTPIISHHVPSCHSPTSATQCLPSSLPQSNLGGHPSCSSSSWNYLHLFSLSPPCLMDTLLRPPPCFTRICP